MSLENVLTEIQDSNTLSPFALFVYCHLHFGKTIKATEVKSKSKLTILQGLAGQEWGGWVLTQFSFKVSHPWDQSTFAPDPQKTHQNLVLQIRSKLSNVNSFIWRFHLSLDNYLWDLPVLDNFQNKLLSTFCVERLGNSMGLPPCAFPSMLQRSWHFHGIPFILTFQWNRSR